MRNLSLGFKGIGSPFDTGLYFGFVDISVSGSVLIFMLDFFVCELAL